jgi:hypothetical protein
MSNITITIDDRSENLSATELADFLYFFRAINLALADIVPREDYDMVRRPTESEIRKYQIELANYSVEKLDSFFEPKKGLRALKEALALDKTVQAGFGIRGATIKLTKEQFDELMRQDPQTKNNGGFQGFLVGLQNRTNRRTRELELSERDLERILRYKANPNRGGWQSRFAKIFGPHFQ